MRCELSKDPIESSGTASDVFSSRMIRRDTSSEYFRNIFVLFL